MLIVNRADGGRFTHRLAWGGHSYDSKTFALCLLSNAERVRDLCSNSVSMIHQELLDLESRIRLFERAHMLSLSLFFFFFFRDYYPSPQVLRPPADGARCQYASRAEPAEAPTNLIMGSGHEKRTVLLTWSKAVAVAGLVVAIDDVAGGGIAAREKAV